MKHGKPTLVNIFKKERKMQLRQGDVFLELVDSLPAGAKPVHGLVLADGEATGHAHRVKAKSRTAKLFEHAGERFLRVNALASLEHEEHGAIALEPGVYRVRRQREYSPQEIRQVAD